MATSSWTYAEEQLSPPLVSPARFGRGALVVLYTSADCWRGAGISYVGIARGLAAHGFRPHVVTTCDEVTEEFSAAGLAVTQLPLGSGESPRLRRFLRASGAQVLLVDRAHDLRVGTLATVGTDITLLNRYNHFGTAPPCDALTRVAYRIALDGQVFLSWSARDRVLASTPFMRATPTATIHEGVDAQFFCPSTRAASEFRRSRELGTNPFMLAVGALSAEKRYDVIFDALRLLGREAPLFVICGEGPDEPRLRERAQQLALRVRFEGRIPHGDLRGAYNACAALVHAGCVETFGLAVLEAMSCARPVIVSAGGALPEVVGKHGDCGALTAPGSAWDLSGAIRRSSMEPEEHAEMGTRARERARRHFSLEAMERGYAVFVAQRRRIQTLRLANG